jgi:hypothetical protein
MSEASQMLFPLKGKIYLALMNDNTIEPIKVNVNVTAIQILTEYKTKTEELPNIKSIQKPYLKN